MAMEKVIIVKGTPQQKMAKNDNPYLEVFAQDDKKYGIFDSGLWNLFADGASVKLIGEQKGIFFNVTGAETVKDALEAKQAVKSQGEERSGQEVGMWWKQLGDDLRSGHIDKSTPEGKAMRAAYFAQMFSVLPIKL